MQKVGNVEARVGLQEPRGLPREEQVVSEGLNPGCQDDCILPFTL